MQCRYFLFILPFDQRRGNNNNRGNEMGIACMTSCQYMWGSMPKLVPSQSIQRGWPTQHHVLGEHSHLFQLLNYLCRIQTALYLGVAPTYNINRNTETPLNPHPKQNVAPHPACCAQVAGPILNMHRVLFIFRDFLGAHFSAFA